MASSWCERVGAVLESRGWRRLDTPRGRDQWSHEHDGAVLHVAVLAPRGPWWRPASARGPATVWLGVVHPIVDMAFVRAMPRVPSLPADAHVACRLADLAPHVVAAPADVVADALARDGLAWLERYADPRVAAADEVAVDPFVALELAAVVGDVTTGRRVVERARDAAATAPRGARRVSLERRWREALGRLEQP